MERKARKKAEMTRKSLRMVPGKVRRK